MNKVSAFKPWKPTEIPPSEYRYEIFDGMVIFYKIKKVTVVI
jgi:hypothetical protein